MTTFSINVQIHAEYSYASAYRLSSLHTPYSPNWIHVETNFAKETDLGYGTVFSNRTIGYGIFIVNVWLSYT